MDDAMVKLTTIDLVFFFNDTATTEIYTLSLHDALPIFSFNSPQGMCPDCDGLGVSYTFDPELLIPDPSLSFHAGDRKSTRLNSSHANISYAVFCLKKKKLKYVRASVLDRPDSQHTQRKI